MLLERKGPKVSGKWDGIKKQLRRDSREKDWTEVRRCLSTYQAALQMLFSALSV